MPIFDLSKIRQTVESKHPVCILVIDTNVLMNEPDTGKWKVGMGPTLFVLPDGINQELEKIRQRTETPEKAGTRDKARKAQKSLHGLFLKGSITEGITIPAGWAISVPLPDKEQLDMELK